MRVPLLLGLVCTTASAATGVCDVDPGDNGPSELACVAAVQNLGANTVVQDIYRDAMGRTGDQLPVYGTLISAISGCQQANSYCNGDSTASPGTPQGYTCGLTNLHDFTNVSSLVNALDGKWANLYRLLDNHATLPDGCPDWSATTTDGSKDGYKPWEGLVFDLGGPSNQVVLFPVNDHGPQPCESIEYTVYLTNDPFSRDIIDNPTTLGADPNKWNRAKLSKMFLEGWQKIRPGVDPGLSYTIEADSFTSVWSLPCGINFRYVGVIAGNDGKDLPACGFDSDDAELDAVAGLTEGGVAICPDADRDGYVDCNCVGHPPVCDCDDSNANIHPGASETCSDPDLNCDGQPTTCPAAQVCVNGLCLDICGGEFNQCQSGSICGATDAGLSVCQPQDCTVTNCPVGSTCDPLTHICRVSCDGVTCPGNQRCQSGLCVDPCAAVACPSPLLCIAGECKPPCSCFNLDTGCPSGLTCDRPNSRCVYPACIGNNCVAPAVCGANGMCEDPCAQAVCPVGQKCVSSFGGCVSNCNGVTCSGVEVCDPKTGACVDQDCANVTCPAQTVCDRGNCVPSTPLDGGQQPDGGQSKDGGNGSTTSPKPCGCGCSTVDTGAAVIGILGLLQLRAARRRKPRRDRLTSWD